MAVPTFRSAGLQVADKAIVATVVAGIVAGLLIHGTFTVTADFVVDVVGTFDDRDGEAVNEPHADKTATDMRNVRDLAGSFLLMSVEV